jgi:DNA (cytosine-5)-methyltransferase 1
VGRFCRKNSWEAEGERETRGLFSLCNGQLKGGSKMKLGHLDLFCGPGGFATGFEMTGFHSLLGLDIHKPSLETYAHNHPTAKTILADIRDVPSDVIAEQIGAGPLDLMSAGVPCEGFSMANRNRTKFTDERNFLFLEFLRIAEQIRPRFLLIENVANLTRHDGGVFAQEIELGMQALGYRTSSTILDAQNFGVPQRRRRVMFAGALPELNFKWPNPTHGDSKDLKNIVTVGDAILGDLPALSSDESAFRYLSEPQTEYQRWIRGSQETLLNHQAPNHPQETISRIENTPQGAPMYPKFKQRIRLHSEKPSPTVVSGGIRPQFAYGHPTQPRGLSIRERARLMSFPDSYEFLGGIVQGRVQTGDAVPPLLAKAVGEEVKNCLLGITKPEESVLG